MFGFLRKKKSASTPTPIPIIETQKARILPQKQPINNYKTSDEKITEILDKRPENSQKVEIYQSNVQPRKLPYTYHRPAETYTTIINGVITYHTKRKD